MRTNIQTALEEPLEDLLHQQGFNQLIQVGSHGADPKTKAASFPISTPHSEMLTEMRERMAAQKNLIIAAHFSQTVKANGGHVAFQKLH